ncbi:hypothetical protein BsWGS_24330 [Bradybaena similaris]
MARRKGIENDMRRLIKHITGFDESDENFRLCVSFADSNFKYHRYLSPDSHKIHRAIDGLCEKFEVHSQKQKAVDLKELTTLFLDQTGLDGKDYGKTDVHYALLSLLINLAESPTKTDFVRSKEDVVSEKPDDFDWKKYLLDDEDLKIVSFASSDSESDQESLPDTYEDEDTEDSEESNRKKLQQQLLPDSEPAAPLSGDNGDSHPAQPHDHSSKMLKFGMTDEYELLARALTVEYWKGHSKEEDVVGSHAVSNLARDWKNYQGKINEFYTPPAEAVVTELQVLRETLWMLSGITELFIFKYDGKEFRLNPDVYVMHLTAESLESSLRPLMRRASQVCVLQSFVTDIVSQVCSSISSGEAQSVPQTYQAFAGSVSAFLVEFRRWLSDVEKLVMKQEEVMSLERLAYDLNPWLAKVQVVHGIYISGIVSVASISDSCCSSSNCFRTSLLLNALYQAVLEADLTSLCDQESQACFLLHILLKSSEPVIKMISDWINNGQLKDPAGEFIVQRNKKILSLTETFWEKAFVPNMKSPAEGVSLLDVTLQKSGHLDMLNSTTSKKANSQTAHRKTYDNSSNGKSDQADIFLKLGPQFLQPVLSDVVLTGKSMEMLETLGRMAEVRDVDCRIYERPPSLYELFVWDLRLKLGFESGNKTSHSVRGTQALVSDKDSLLDKQLNVPGEKDPLLNINFAAIFPDIDATADDQSKQKNDLFPEFASNDLSYLLRLCESCLYPHVRSRYKTVCSKLVQILKSEYHLMDCIHAMQRYYLMSSGEVLYDFYAPIFQRIMNREFLRSNSILELYLHEAVEPRFPQDLSKLTVTVSSDSNQKEKRPINQTDCIRLKYKVPWPVDVVISGKCQELYNDIFTFLLQIKRAKYSVDQLRFEDLSRQQAVHSELRLLGLNDATAEAAHRATRVCRFHLLRFRLLYFVNSLHNYMMTRILHSTGIEFASQLEEAIDLEQIISVHRKYAEAIHERCLLHQKLSFLKEAVVSVLNLSLTFSMLWMQGVDFVSDDQTQEMETELSRCIHFLASFLGNLIKRGSFPHLESLAFALISSLQHADKTLTSVPSK